MPATIDYLPDLSDLDFNPNFVNKLLLFFLRVPPCCVRETNGAVWNITISLGSDKYYKASTRVCV